MRTVINNTFSEEPPHIVYYADQIAVHDNIRRIEIETEEGTQVKWLANSTYYLPDEYKSRQDEEVRLAEARAVTTSFEAALELLGE